MPLPKICAGLFQSKFQHLSFCNSIWQKVTGHYWEKDDASKVLLRHVRTVQKKRKMQLEEYFYISRNYLSRLHADVTIFTSIYQPYLDSNSQYFNMIANGLQLVRQYTFISISNTHSFCLPKIYFLGHFISQM